MSRFHIILIALLGMFVFVSCVHLWPNKLAGIPTIHWVDKDQISFFKNSPWIEHGEGEVIGIKDNTKAKLDIAATWVSLYFRETKKEILTVWNKEDYDIIRFDNDAKEQVAIKNAPVIVKSEAPYKLTHKLAIASPVFLDGFGIWPTSVKAAKEAHKQLHLTPFPDTNFEIILDEQSSLMLFLMVDVAFTPMVQIDPSIKSNMDVNTCFTRLLGQMAARGVSLVRPDGEAIYPFRMVVLGHDINNGWNDAMKSSLNKGELTTLAPAFVRFFFLREHKEKGVFLQTDTNSVKLVMEAPEQTADLCAMQGHKGLEFKSEIEFNLKKMMVAGPGSI